MSGKEYENDIVIPELPAEIKNVISSGKRVSSRTVDDFLTGFSLSAVQRAAMAEALFDLVICDGAEKTIRRAVFKQRVKRGWTLKALAIRSPFPCKRLENIESGNFQRLSAAECHFFGDVFGLVCIPETPQILSEPDEESVLLTLSELVNYDGTSDLSEFTEGVFVREFPRRKLYGLSGVVVSCKCSEVGFSGRGELLMQITDAQSDEESDEAVVLCYLTDGFFRVALLKDRGVVDFTGSMLEKKSVCWMIRVKKLVYQDRSLFSWEE